MYSNNLQQLNINQLEEKPFLNLDDFAVPCGLLPSNFPLDHFQSLFSQDDNNLIFEVEDPDSHSTYSSRYKFYNLDLEKQWMDVENSRFSHWMVRLIRECHLRQSH
jgi:hypothetical protein